MGTTDELFGQDEQEERPLNESEKQMLQGDLEGMPEGDFYKHPIVDRAYRVDFKKDPEKYLADLDRKIEELYQFEPQTEEDYEKIMQARENLEKVREGFPQMLELEKANKKAYDEAYKKEFEKARELSERTGNIGGFTKILEMKGVIPRSQEVPETEIQHSQKVKKAIEKAQKSGDWSHVFRLTGL